MIKKLSYISLFLILYSCSLTRDFSGHINKKHTISIDVKPIKTHVKVDTTKYLSGSSKSLTLFYLFRFSKDFKYLDIQEQSSLEMKAALYNALYNTNYDILINPKYIIEKKRFLFIKKVSVLVSGYGGKLIYE